MKFWEAMKCLEEGKKVRKKIWHKDGYLTIKNNHIVDEWDDDEIVSTFSLDGEWEIYEPKKEVDEKFKELYHYLKDENGFTNGQYGEFIYNRNETDHLLEFYRQLLEMAKYYKLD